jgi:hypothetical protein
VEQVVAGGRPAHQTPFAAGLDLDRALAIVADRGAAEGCPICDGEQQPAFVTFDLCAAVSRAYPLWCT